MEQRILTFVLAGGKGTRLYPLTKERAKPAVPFGGRYRIVDFVLSNLVNSGLLSVYVLIQFKSQSLLQHLRDGWEMSGLLKHHFIIPVPAQMRSPGESWYRGTADAIFQNVNLIEQSRPSLVVVFGADHIYRMDVRQMVDFHLAQGADVTVSAIPVERHLSKEFGVIEVDEEGRIMGFHEKKTDAPTMPGRSTHVYASMGNYIFSTDYLLKVLYEDAEDEDSSHDFGRNILPASVESARLFAYNFQTNRIDGDPEDQPVYWRDVGTIRSYFDANMDLRTIRPLLNLYNRHWPLKTAGYEDPPAKFTFDEDGRRGQAVDSVVSGGCILSGGMVRRSVLGRGVRVHTGAIVEDSIIFDNCDIGRHSRVRRAILDKNVTVREGTQIGFNVEEDRKLYHLSEDGIVVVPGRRSRVEIISLSR